MHINILCVLKPSGVCDQFLFVTVNITELGVESTIEHAASAHGSTISCESTPQQPFGWQVQQFKAVVLELVHTGDYIKLQPPFREVCYLISIT